MTDAPERIWTRAHEGVRDSGFWIGHDGHHLPTQEYTRTDLVEALIAEAVAKERERCAQIGYRICAETRHGTLGDKVATAISGEPTDRKEDYGRAAAIRAGKGE